MRKYLLVFCLFPFLAFINGLEHLMLDKTNIHSLLVIRNDFKLKTIRLELRNKDYYILFDFTDGSKEEHPVGMDNQYKISEGRISGLPVALKGIWENNKLIIWYNELCRINLYMYTFTFNDRYVDLQIQDQTNERNVLLKGSIVE
jgi:hypothetical protein